MPWLPSFLKSKPKTSYKYETQADLDKLTADEIIHLDPKEVSLNVDKNKGDIKLTGDKRDSMLSLLSIKREEERNPSLIRFRASVIDGILRNKSEAEKLVRDTQAEIDAEAAELNTMKNRITLLKMKNAPTGPINISKKGGRKSLRRRATRAKRAIRRSYKMSHKRMQRTRRR
jgi:hypothetical protein